MASTKKSRELAKALKQVPYDVGMEHGIRIGKAEGITEGKAEGKTEGAEETKLSIAKRLISMGMDNEAIHESTELPMKTIEEIRKQVK